MYGGGGKMPTSSGEVRAIGGAQFTPPSLAIDCRYSTTQQLSGVMTVSLWITFSFTQWPLFSIASLANALPYFSMNCALTSKSSLASKRGALYMTVQIASFKSKGTPACIFSMEMRDRMSSAKSSMISNACKSKSSRITASTLTLAISSLPTRNSSAIALRAALISFAFLFFWIFILFKANLMLTLHLFSSKLMF